VVSFDQIPAALPGGRKMHCDIVIEVNANDVVTVGATWVAVYVNVVILSMQIGD
jgi:hypothetical protein